MAKNIEKQQKTQRRLMDALIDLCNTKGYYNITVSDICQQAKMYRSTFYRYYDSKDDLLRAVEEAYVESTRKLTSSLHNYDLTHFMENRSIYLEQLTEDMYYHQRHRNLTLFLLSPHGDPNFSRQMQKSLRSNIKGRMEETGISYGKLQHYLVDYIANGFISTLHDWLKNQDCSPEEIADFLLTMIHELPLEINHVRAGKRSGR